MQVRNNYEKDATARIRAVHGIAAAWFERAGALCILPLRLSYFSLCRVREHKIT